MFVLKQNLLEPDRAPPTKRGAQLTQKKNTTTNTRAPRHRGIERRAMAVVHVDRHGAFLLPADGAGRLVAIEAANRRPGWWRLGAESVWWSEEWSGLVGLQSAWWFGGLVVGWFGGWWLGGQGIGWWFGLVCGLDWVSQKHSTRTQASMPNPGQTPN